MLYEVLDDMASKDAGAKENFGDDYQESKLGSKLHRAFMSEIGEEMSQTEVAHHASKAPEYLCSRPEKHVHFYKKALALRHPPTKKENAQPVEDDWAEGSQEHATISTQRSDIDIYESRALYSFWPPGTPLSPDLPPKDTPEEQIFAANTWGFFRIVRYRGGRSPYLEWHPEGSRPIVLMSPYSQINRRTRLRFWRTLGFDAVLPMGTQERHH